MFQNVDDFLFGYFTGRHKFLQIMRNTDVNTPLTANTLTDHARTLDNPCKSPDDMCVERTSTNMDMDSNVLFQAINTSIRDIILSIIPLCFRNPADQILNQSFDPTTNTLIQISMADHKHAESKHLQTFEDFLNVCRYVGERLMMVIIDGLSVRDVDISFLQQINSSHDELTTDDIVAYIEATNHNYDKCAKHVHKLIDSGTDTYAKHCILRRFMVNVIKIGIMRSLYELVETPELVSTDTWGIMNVEEFTHGMRSIVDREIKQGSDNRRVTKELSGYYAKSLLNVSQMFHSNTTALSGNRRIAKDSDLVAMDIDWTNESGCEFQGESQTNDDENMEPVPESLSESSSHPSIQIPEKIKKLIQTFITENHTIKMCFNMFDGIFSNVYKNYRTVRSEIKSNLYLIIFLLIWDIKLKGPIKTKFMSDAVVMKGIIPTINTIYLGPITDMMNNLNEYTTFINVYEDTVYPPVFLSPSATLSFNSLFQKVYHTNDEQHDLELFKEKFYDLVHTKVGYLSDMIVRGIEHATKRGIDVLTNLYNRCKEQPNVLVIKDTYLIENCPMNPSSPYFMNVLNSTMFVRYYSTIGAESVRSLKRRRYTSYVDNLHNFMMASTSEPKQRYTDIVIKYYKSSVTNPIDMEVFTEYISKYYDFVKAAYQKTSE